MVRGLKFARDFGASSIILESDCSPFVGLVRGLVVDFSEIGLVVEEIQHLSLHFACFSVAFGSRKVNCVAHALAKLALASVGNLFLFDSVPFSVESFVLADLSE
ncbi:hypothetical protein ACOSP7_023037 [Xanthoceras sorbifolium]